jgi:hypothetical protein
MVYRDAIESTLCSVCRNPGQVTCARCGRPLCREHAPAEAMRCGPCEAWFAEQRSSRAGPFSLANLALPSRAAAIAMLLTPAGVVGAAVLWEHARRRRERNRFLAERGPSVPTPGVRRKRGAIAAGV